MRIDTLTTGAGSVCAASVTRCVVEACGGALPVFEAGLTSPASVRTNCLARSPLISLARSLFSPPLSLPLALFLSLPLSSLSDLNGSGARVQRAIIARNIIIARKVVRLPHGRARVSCRLRGAWGRGSDARKRHVQS